MFPISLTSQPKKRPDPTKLGFGQYFTDHMFVASYSKNSGWSKGEILPYAPFQMDPAAAVFHYGQALFEGLKAFRRGDGKLCLFRPDYNWKRMQVGAERLCLVAPPREMFLESMKALVKVDQDWVPEGEGSALYLRPTLIGTEAFLGVRPAEEILFFVIASPVGSYFGTGFSSVKIWVEKEFIRAAPGGLGFTKAGANYANSLKAAVLAKQKGYSQVLWLDTTRTFIEEVGTMNVFFVIKDEILTPTLDGTILAGGTRDSVLSLLRKKGLKVSERKISLQEILEASKRGELKEAFGTGTAAVITPIGELASEDFQLKFKDPGPESLTLQLYQEISQIQRGLRPDPENWIFTLDT